jgi:collagenase-like PrtC family protease
MDIIRPKTELLSPAGTIKNMRFAYGADAVTGVSD